MKQPPYLRSLKSTQALSILVLGALSPNKGADCLEACAVLAKQHNLPLEFQLLGYGYRHLLTQPYSNLSVYGPYQDEQLPQLIEKFSSHLIWFPAQWPETYSYTLSMALRLRLPVVATNLGAFAERLAERPLSWIYPWNLTPLDWNQKFLELRTRFLEIRSQQEVPSTLLTIAKAAYYQNDYLQPMKRN